MIFAFAGNYAAAVCSHLIGSFAVKFEQVISHNH
jgi:hypothetical protein